MPKRWPLPVRRLAETSAPAAMAETKRLVYRHLGGNYVQALQEADRAQLKFVTLPDAAEGAAGAAREAHAEVPASGRLSNAERVAAAAAPDVIQLV